MKLIEFIIINGNYFIICVLGLFIIKLLLTIERDLNLLHSDLGETNQQLNKLLNSLMSSLNDVRKLVHQKVKPVRKDH